jgi:hydrogenase maturation protease
MIPVLIIGYGNPLRSDDGIGWQAARTLYTAWPSSKVRVEAAHQLLPEMADWIGDAEYVIFIDACWDLLPGRMRSHAIHPEGPTKAPMTHHFSPERLLADGWHLFHHCPEAVMISVGGGSFDYGEGLSKTVQATFPELLAHVRRLVQKRVANADTRKAEQHA